MAHLEDVLEELPQALLNIDIKSDAAAGPFLRTITRCGAFDWVGAAAFFDARLAHSVGDRWHKSQYAKADPRS